MVNIFPCQIELLSSFVYIPGNFCVLYFIWHIKLNDCHIFILLFWIVAFTSLKNILKVIPVPANKNSNSRGHQMKSKIFF